MRTPEEQEQEHALERRRYLERARTLFDFLREDEEPDGPEA